VAEERKACERAPKVDQILQGMWSEPLLWDRILVQL
jgi:hypothetical protein